MQLRGTSPGLLAIACLAAACSSSDGAPGDGSADGATDAGVDAGDGGSSALPITMRPSRGTYTCRVGRDRTSHVPRVWTAPPALSQTSGGTAFLARVESMSSIPVSPGVDQLLLSAFDKDGSFGTPTVVPAGAPGDIGSLAAAPSGAGVAVVWAENQTLHFAAFDASGAATVAPKQVLTGVDRLAQPALATGPDGGLGVVFSPQVGAGNQFGIGPREVRFLVLDPSGAVRMAPRTLSQGAGGLGALPGAAIVGTADGYAMIWRDPTSTRGGIDFARADAAGNQTVARRRISLTDEANTVVGGGAGFESPRTALVRTGDGYLAAWTEVRTTQSFDAGAWATVQLARLDGSGALQGAPAPLRAPTDSIDEVEPSLVRFHDAIGVLWARGSHIYVCAGCVPDHRIDLMLVDPADLTPISNVVSVTNGGEIKAGGLLYRQVAVIGDSLLTAFQLTFHVHSTPGSALFTCER